MSFCSECSLSDHCGHQVAYAQDIIERACEFNFTLNREVRLATTAVREAMDTLHRMSGKIEVKLYRTGLNIQSFFKR